MPGDGKETTPLNLKTDFTLSANEHELRSQALAAYTADNKDTSIVLSGSQRSAIENRSADSRKRQGDQQQTQLSIADQARRLSEHLGRQIAQMEDAFEAEMGDAWREQIANKVMDPDDIPPRRDGETMAEYRERLETVLIATMIDENGQIRAKYANDPDTARYAEWAQAQYLKNEIDNASDAELEQIVSEAAERQQLRFTDDRQTGVGLNTAQVNEVADLADQQRAEVESSAKAEAEAFGLG